MNLNPCCGVRIVGIGSALPEQRLTNEDMSKLVETSDEWIFQRTGIRERRIAGEGETTASLGAAAARKAIADAGLTERDIGMIIVATATPEMAVPSTACFVGADLGLPGTPAFDISAACSGFLYALHTGANFVKSGQHDNILVIGSETLTRIVNYTDRESCIVFGDGAGAVVLQRSPETGRGILYGTLHADGIGAELIKCQPGSRFPITEDMVRQKQHLVQLRGREVYKFAVTRFEELVRDALDKCNVSMDDLALIVPHQVNQRIIESVMGSLGLSMDKVYSNIDRYGNTSSASIPIALDEAKREGRFQGGDIVVMAAFGAGLTWGSAVVQF
jgi:3-oxoacyl-[acyl-carrier-protein] synthase-3